MRNVYRTMIGQCGVLALSVFFLSTSVAANDQQVIALDMRTAVTRALLASEELQIQQNESARIRSKYQKERSSLRPTINGEIVWANNFEYPDIVATTYQKKYSLDAGVTVSQALFTFGKISSSIAAAQKAVLASGFSEQGEKRATIYATKVAYYTAWLAQQTLRIAERSLENAQHNKDIVEARSANGRVSKYDAIKLSADISSRIPVVTSAQANFDSAMETLKRIVGIERGIQVELTDPLPSEYPAFERERLVRDLYENQPMIRSLAEVVTSKKYALRAKRLEFFPEITAFATWDHTGSGDRYSIGSENLDGYGVAGLKITVPLWAKGETANDVEEARINTRNAELRYQEGKEKYILEVDKVFSEYEGYRKTLTANEEAIRWAEESFHLSRDMLASGQISLTDLNDAELRLTNQRLNKESTVFYLHEALARIERLTSSGASYEK